MCVQSVVAFFGSTRLIYSNQDRKATFAEMDLMELVAFMYVKMWMHTFTHVCCVMCVVCGIFYSNVNPTGPHRIIINVTHIAMLCCCSFKKKMADMKKTGQRM